MATHSYKLHQILTLVSPAYYLRATMMLLLFNDRRHRLLRK